MTMQVDAETIRCTACNYERGTGDTARDYNLGITVAFKRVYDGTVVRYRALSPESAYRFCSAECSDRLLLAIRRGEVQTLFVPTPKPSDPWDGDPPSWWQLGKATCPVPVVRGDYNLNGVCRGNPTRWGICNAHRHRRDLPEEFKVIADQAEVEIKRLAGERVREARERAAIAWRMRMGQYPPASWKAIGCALGLQGSAVGEAKAAFELACRQRGIPRDVYEWEVYPRDHGGRRPDGYEYLKEMVPWWRDLAQRDSDHVSKLGREMLSRAHIQECLHWIRLWRHLDRLRRAVGAIRKLDAA